MTKQQLFHKFVLVANPKYGSASFSLRIKCALENLGHTVFLFTPSTHPALFSDSTAFKGANLKRFLTTQKPHCVLFADAVEMEGEGYQQPFETPIVRGCIVSCEDDASCCKGDAEGGCYDFVLATNEKLAAMVVSSRLFGDVYTIHPFADRSYVNNPIANTIALEPGIVCIQNATPMGIEIIDRLHGCNQLANIPIRCAGEGWPDHLKLRFTGENSLVYALRSSMLLLTFDDDTFEMLPGNNLLPLAKAEGMPWVHVGAQLPDVSFEAEASVVPDCNSAKDLISNILQQHPLEKSRRMCTGTMSDDDKRAHTLEDELALVLDKLTTPLSSANPLRGENEPRTIVAIMGYFGMRNFGDEYILASLDRCIRAKISGATVVAVSENPYHTLEERGIYALSLKNLIAVDRLLSFSSAALVVAGLLFDQGIRWTAGKADAFASARCSDIPGIAVFSTLASLNDTPMIFHGIGAGPLEVADARKLVRLMGQTGAIFTPRDKETGDIIRSCGVHASQVIECADTVFSINLTEANGEQSSSGKGSARILAISLREYENLPSDFAMRVAHALDDVCACHSDITPTFCILDPDDAVLSASIMEAMQYKNKTQTINCADDIDALVGFLSGAFCGFSMRYHCSLVLNSLGIPCAGMDYLPKVTSLYHDTGSKDLLVSTDATTEDIIRVLNEVIENNEIWQNKIDPHVTLLREKSGKAFEVLLEKIEEVRDSKSLDIQREYFLPDEVAFARDISYLRSLTESRDSELLANRETIESIQKELTQVRSSKSFRLGKALLALPRAVRSLFAS